MLRSIKALETAQAYDQAHVRVAAGKLLGALDAELTECVYEEGTAVEEATLELEEAMNVADVEAEESSSDEEDEL